MSEKIEIKTGKKIDRDELLKTDISHLAVMITRPRQSEQVEGQYLYNAMTRCPWCGNVGWTYGLSTDFYTTVICGACGQPFQA
jgi:hypothetical protein